MPDPTHEQIREVACPTCRATPSERCVEFVPGGAREIQNHPARIDAYLRREEGREQGALMREIDELAREVKEWLESRKSVDDAATFGFNPALWREAKRQGREQGRADAKEQADGLFKITVERLEKVREVRNKLLNTDAHFRHFLQALVEDGQAPAVALLHAKHLLEQFPWEEAWTMD